MTDSTRGTGGAGDLPTPPLPTASAPADPAPAPSRAARRAAAASGSPAVDASPVDASPVDAAGPVEPGSNRRRNIIIAAAIGAVVIIGGAVAALGGAFDAAEPLPVPTASTITLASPTPTVAPIARQPISAFADALPSTVLDLALTAIAPQPTLVAANALEGYRLDYSDGGSVTVALDAGQWETPEEAAAAYAPIAAAAPVTETGSVDVGGAPVGSWTLSEAADGTGALTWTNGTALFHATGPAATVRSLYEAFPL